MAGNANSGRRKGEKPFADALRMELLAVGSDHKALRAIARKLIEMATEGDLPAIIELANRTDGKVPQGVDANVSGDVMVQIIRYSDAVTIEANPVIEGVYANRLPAE